MVTVRLNGVLPAVKLTRKRMSHIRMPSMEEESAYVAACFVTWGFPYPRSHVLPLFSHDIKHLSVDKFY